MKALAVAYDALHDAIAIDDDPSLSTVLDAAANAARELSTLQGATP